MNIAICDDIEQTRGQIAQIVKSYFVNKNLSTTNIATFSEASTLLNSIKSKNYFDIIFLDIEMPHMSGMECAAQIRTICTDTLIIFVTSHSEYMPNAFSVEAFGYIDKSNLCKNIYSVLDRCLKKYQLLHQEVLFSNRKQHLCVIPKDILYIESFRKLIIFHMCSGEEIPFTYTLKECEKQLLNFNFSRCRLTLLVNLAYVKEINDNTIVMKYNHEKTIFLPIGEAYSESFLEAFMFYKTRKGASSNK